VALISRSDERHAGYLADLAEAGVEAASYTADVTDRHRLLGVLDAVAERFGTIDVVYYGPGAADLGAMPVPIAQTDSDGVRQAMSCVYPAIDVVAKVLPEMTKRGDGGLLFAGGLSSVVPMPALGDLAVSSAALRNYALTLNAGLAEQGVYAGTLTIGGLIERGDIHTMLTAQPERFGDVGTLDPDDIAETAYRMYIERDRPEAVFTASEA
jgi:NADP-dependent 3-hydroxy acid dehydrogenase YdfG